jgi:hypothetical protein
MCAPGNQRKSGNTLLRPLVNAIDRIPLNEQASEAIMK